MIQPILFLNDAQVAELLPPPAALQAVEAGLKLHATGCVDQPLKPYLRPGGRANEFSRGRVIYMPAYVGGDINMIGAKMIAGFPINIDRGLPRASGLIVLNSPDTGLPLAVMECGTLSARRTAAIAQLCFRELAPRGTYSVGLLGAGPIAAAVIEALSQERDLARINIFDPRTDRSEELASRKRPESGPTIAAVDTIEAATLEADCVVTATVGSKGYLTQGNCGAKRLFVALSLDDASEDLFLSFDKIVVDSFDDCNREDKLLHRLVQKGAFSRDRVHAEIGEILIGTKHGRQAPDETFFVNPMGMAVEDVAAAALVYRTALRNNVGTLIN
jgi:2,3-diaminopropionate biosynthesis protein SbnB